MREGERGRRGARARRTLREEGADDFAVDVGEAVVAALEAIGEARVVEAEGVEPARSTSDSQK